MIDLGLTKMVAEGVLAFGSVSLRSRRPLVVNHLVTVRCNLACPFCYVSGPEQLDFNRQRYPKQAEMSTAEMCDLYRQLVQAGFKLIVIVGGEPLLRTDLDDMLAVLDGHVYASVFSNGMLLEERHELLRRAPSLFVSLDAPDEQHDRLRDRPGCFARALAGIERVRSRQPHVKVALMMTVTDQNVTRVGDMLAFARELDLPVGFQPPSYDGQFALEGRPTAVAEERVPACDQIADAFRVISEAARRQTVLGSQAFFDLVIRGDTHFRCQYPFYVLGPILPNGDVVGCTDSRVIANLRSSSVAEVLRSDAYRVNAARGPSCDRGCRDWGIFDVSALHNRQLRPGDLLRLGRAFLSGPLRRPPGDHPV